MTRDNQELLTRTRSFSLSIIRFYSQLPGSVVGQILGRQLLRSATSVGAHYREAQRARSDADFVSKIECGLQELDETVYWLELIRDSKLAPDDALTPLLAEAEELLRILVSIARAAKRTSVKRKG